MKNNNLKHIRRIDFLENNSAMPNTYICDESINPTGTIKDVRNRYVLKEALRLGVDKLVAITAGNSGYSLGKLARGTGIDVVCIVSRDIEDQIFNRLEEVTHQVIKINLDDKILRPEEILSFAREKDDEVIWDVTNGYEESYAEILKEILDKVDNPNYIVVPLGSGSIFVGFCYAVKRLSPHTKVIAIGPQSTSSIADKLSTPWTPYKKAINAYVEEGHFVYRISENEIRMTFNKYSRSCDCEVSSSVVFYAPKIHSFKKDDIIVFLNTGKLRF